METIPSIILGQQVEGLNLAPGSLQVQYDAEPTLFVFLRHLG